MGNRDPGRTKTYKDAWRAAGKENTNVWTGPGVAKKLKRIAVKTFNGTSWTDALEDELTPELVRRVVDKSGLPAQVEQLKTHIARLEAERPPQVVPNPPPKQVDSVTPRVEVKPKLPTAPDPWEPICTPVAPIEIDPADLRWTEVAFAVGYFVACGSVGCVFIMLLIHLRHGLSS